MSRQATQRRLSRDYMSAVAQSKPKQPKLVVRRMWFSLNELAERNFTDVVKGDITGGVEMATALWLERHVGWWSATLTAIGTYDSGDSGECTMNVRPPRMVSPAELMDDVRKHFEQFKAQNTDFTAVDVVAMITISNRKPVSVYGGAA